MSDTAAEAKETQVATSPEKKDVCERKPAAKEEAKQENGKDKPEQNGDAKSEESTEEKPVENGDSTDVCSLPQKRKSESGASDSTDSTTTKEGASPEKKAKLEEKVENGEAEAKA